MTSSNTLFRPHQKDIQFAVIEEERNQERSFAFFSQQDCQMIDLLLKYFTNNLTVDSFLT